MRCKAHGAQHPRAARHELAFAAPTTGIIVNLALFFAWHVLWPEGLSGEFEWFAALIGIGAFIALFKYKVGVVQMIAACAITGLGYSLLG